MIQQALVLLQSTCTPTHRGLSAAPLPLLQDAPFDISVDCMGTRSECCSCPRSGCTLACQRCSATDSHTGARTHAACGCHPPGFKLSSGRGTLSLPAAPSPCRRRAAAGHAVGDQAQRPHVAHLQCEATEGQCCLLSASRPGSRSLCRSWPLPLGANLPARMQAQHSSLN